MKWVNRLTNSFTQLVFGMIVNKNISHKFLVKYLKMFRNDYHLKLVIFFEQDI